MYGEVLEVTGILRSAFTSAALQAQDDARVTDGDRKATEAFKRARKRRRRVRKGLEDKIQHTEGAMYRPGITD